ncbi:uncharacterized protein METZ01_LOCUS213701 [marine metagenome]|uniref:Uncharacterized protein n=1 Tax=marine metagenome TaxID=408172 RepID=A0A382FFF2_9ZZZZ
MIDNRWLFFPFGEENDQSHDAANYNDRNSQTNQQEQ